MKLNLQVIIRFVMQKCDYCSNEFKGQRGVATHLKSCAAYKEAETLRIIASVRPKFASVAPTPVIEQWAGRKGPGARPWGGAGPYSATGEVDPETGNFVYTIWDSCDARVRIDDGRAGSVCTRTKLQTLQAVGKIARPGGIDVAVAPVRIYEYEELTSDLKWSGPRTYTTKIDIE
jgi:hypothetical protein